MWCIPNIITFLRKSSIVFDRGGTRGYANPTKNELLDASQDTLPDRSQIYSSSKKLCCKSGRADHDYRREDCRPEETNDWMMTIPQVLNRSRLVQRRRTIG